MVASNIRIFIQDHYALMQQGSSCGHAIFAAEELMKYYEPKPRRKKEEAAQGNLSSVEIDEPLFGYDWKSHEYS